MGFKTWIYVIILILVLGGGGYFFWRMYKGGKIAPKAEVSPTPQTFCDVASGYWAFDEIEAVNQAGYMWGYDSLCTPDVDGKKQFKPTDGTVRHQMAAAFSRASGGPGSVTCPPDPYPDVTSAWSGYGDFCPAIKDVTQKGYMQGYEDGTFKPDQITTRTEGAITLSRAKALDIESPPATPTFDDVAITADNSNHYKEIEAIYKAGYTTGCSMSTDSSGKVHLNYCPTDPLLREQLAVFLYNAYLKTGVTSPAVSSPTPKASPSTPTPTPPTPTPTVTPTPTPTETVTATPTTTTGAGTPGATTTTTTKTATTGPEIPLAGGGILGVLFIIRYLVNRRIR